MPTQVANNTSARNVPDKIGKYEIINEIGKGTTGDVFLSHLWYARSVPSFHTVVCACTGTLLSSSSLK